MNLHRHLATVTAVSLVGLVPVDAATTAQAAELAVIGTTATVEKSSPRKLVHGDTASLVLKVRAATGASVSTGTTQLQRSVRGRAWTNVGRATRAGGFVLVNNVKVNEKTRYRVRYSGGQDSSGTFTPSTSAPLTVTVARKITAPKKGFVLKGKVTPNFKNKRLVIKTSQRSTGGFKTWKRVRTTKAGTYKVRLPRRSGTRYWKVIVPGDSRYAKNSYTWRTWVF